MGRTECSVGLDPTVGGLDQARSSFLACDEILIEKVHRVVPRVGPIQPPSKAICALGNSL
ncbi:hypothetical protein NC653_006795 [Populus alba x Populus x berolinensis]|uniref:Uncharacterized protein n=1 Tax=Populus alba x Populus x berolinensis TaxID=444605 RepID=A0AAD6WCL3_9ROSI|nr:hypothetical protein NC653_006795 [Populus alba x Populus x berolinensis]